MITTALTTALVTVMAMAAIIVLMGIVWKIYDLMDYLTAPKKVEEIDWTDRFRNDGMYK